MPLSDDFSWILRAEGFAAACAISAFTWGALVFLYFACRRLYIEAQDYASKVAPARQLALHPSLVFKSPLVSTNHFAELAEKNVKWRELCDWGVLLLVFSLNANLSTFLQPNMAAGCHSEKQRLRLLLLLFTMMKLAWIRPGSLKDIRWRWIMNVIRLLASWSMLIHSYSMEGQPCLIIHPLTQEPWRRYVSLLILFPLMNTVFEVGGRLAVCSMLGQICLTFYTGHLLMVGQMQVGLEYFTCRCILLVIIVVASYWASYVGNQQAVMRYIQQNAHVFS